jgi:hypothetical protein
MRTPHPLPPPDLGWSPPCRALCPLPCRELNSTGLEGPLEWGTLAQLSQLRVINLFNNSLSGTLGGPLPASLTFLSVSLNYLTGTIPNNWQLPDSLQELWLAYNQIEGSIPWKLSVSHLALGRR